MGTMRGVEYTIDLFLFTYNASKYFKLNEQDPRAAQHYLKKAVEWGQELVATGGYVSDIQRKALGKMELELANSANLALK